MAYQPKSYRKFLATSVAAAMVATAVAPAALAAEAKEVSFTDVQENHRFATEIYTLAEMGIVGGIGNDQFAPGADLTRSQAALMLARALNLVDEDDKLVEEATVEQFGDVVEGTRAYDAILALREAGIAGGNLAGEYNPEDNITRGEMAMLVARAFQLEAKTDENPFTDLYETSADAVQKLFDHEITLGKTATTFAPGEDITRAEFAAFTYRALDGAGLLPGEETPVEELAVESVSAINNIQVLLTFNTALDADTINTDNIKEDNATIDIDTLEVVDSNKVLVTFDAAFANQTSVKLTLNNVKSSAGAVIAEDTELSATFFDVTVPVAQSVQSVGPDKFKVVFSEPVDLATAEDTANYSVNGGEYFISSAVRTSLNEVTVTLYSTLADGSYEVGIKNVQDLAGYKVVDTKLTLNHVTDTVAPSVASVISATPNKVVLEFTEDITLNASSAALIDAAKVYHTNSANVPDLIAVSSTNGKRLELTFTTKPLPQGGTAYFVIDKDVVKDGWNNKNARYTSNINVTVDTVKPELVKVESPTDKTFKLTFSEDVKEDLATDIANYKFLDSTGKEVSVNLNKIELGTDNKTVTITLNSALSGGTYGIVVEKVEDLAGNVIDKVTKMVTVTDTTAPEIVEDGVLYDTKKIVKVSFNEAMATTGAGSVLNLGNYRIGGKFLNNTKATISITDNGKAVLIDLSKETTITFAANNTDVVTVGKVADVAGNFVDAFSTPVTLKVADVVEIASAKATAKNTLVVTLDDSLSKFNASDFVISTWNDANDNDEVDAGELTALTASTVRFSNVDGKGVITFTLASNSTLTTDALKGELPVVITTTTATSSENIFGVTLGTSLTATVADAIAPELVLTTVDNKDVADVKFNGTDKVTLNFSEEIAADTLSRLTFTVEGYKVTAAGLGTDKSVVELTVEATATNPSATPNVTQVYDITDSVGNVFKSGTTWKALAQ